MALKLSIFIIFIVLCIATYFLFTGPNELTIKLENIDMHKQLVLELDKNQIPYNINTDGAIKYPIEYDAKVSNIFDETFEINRTAIYITNLVRRDEIVKKLDSNEIPFKLSEENEKIKISWSNDYSNKVHEVLNMEFAGGPLDK